MQQNSKQALAFRKTGTVCLVFAAFVGLLATGLASRPIGTFHQLNGNTSSRSLNAIGDRLREWLNPQSGDTVIITPGAALPPPAPSMFVQKAADFGTALTTTSNAVSQSLNTLGLDTWKAKPVPQDAVAIAAASASATGGGGGLEIVTSNPIAISNPVTNIGGTFLKQTSGK